jgi:hypothetical protein
VRPLAGARGSYVMAGIPRGLIACGATSLPSDGDPKPFRDGGIAEIQYRLLDSRRCGR